MRDAARAALAHSAACAESEKEKEKEKRLGGGRTVLQLRGVGEGVWESTWARDLDAAPPALDTRALEAALRAVKRDDADRRDRALVEELGAQAERAALGALAAAASRAPVTRLRAAAMRVFEALARAISLCTAKNESTAARLCARALRRPLRGENLRALAHDLRVGSITYALAFCVYALVARAPTEAQRADESDSEDSDSRASGASGEPQSQSQFEEPVFLGVPAMLREARAHAFHAHARDQENTSGAEATYAEATYAEATDACRTNPADTRPNPAGGALPDPASFVFSVGDAQDGFVGYQGTVLLRGGGLLAVLPGWRGTRPDGCVFAHYVRVDPVTRVASVLRVSSARHSEGSEDEPASASVLLRFKLGVDPEDPAARVGWIDAQRDFEGNLVLAWGSFNALTGGVARSYYMGLVEADAYPSGADPFRELDKGDVDDMFAARLEAAAAIDFRDHGNVLEAVVRGGSTTVVYHDTIVKELRGIELAAVWGTAHAFVGWTFHQERVFGGTWEGAQRAGDLEAAPGSCRLQSLGLALLDERGAERRACVSIAPWWGGSKKGGREAKGDASS
jgi:hypothetical protein